MRKSLFIPIALFVATSAVVVLVSFRQADATADAPRCHVPAADPAFTSAVKEPAKGCVFKTVYEGEGLDPSFVLQTPENVVKSEKRGLDWLIKAQANDGGFGSGSHARQDITDPHAVSTDPATTAMVGMALLRMGNTPDKGEHAAHHQHLAVLRS